MRKNPENPWYGDPNGHRIAALMRWGKLPKGRVRRYRKRGRPSVSRLVPVRRKRRYVVKKRRTVKHRRTGFGSRVGLMRMHTERASGRVRSRVRFPHLAFASGRPGGREFGHNPFLGRLSMAKRRRSRKRNTWFGQPRRHKKAARLGWKRGHVGVRRRKRSASRRRRNPEMGNPFRMSVRRRRRSAGRTYRRVSRRRRNPAFGGAMIGKFTGGVMDIRGWGPLAVTGAFSAITGSVVPAMIGVVNPWAKLGVQTAIAIGGGIVVEQTIDKRHGQAWMIVGVAMVGYQLLKQFVLIPYLPQFAVGLGQYEEYSDYNPDQVSQQVGAFTDSVSAFPSMSAYPGVGEEVGSYPYDGSGY